MTRLYFIDLEGPARINGPVVKIGCSISPPERLRRYQVWSPFPLRLLGAVEGNFQDEAAVKRALAADRSHQEWFRLTQRLEAFLRGLLDEGKPLAGMIAALVRGAP